MTTITTVHRQTTRRWSRWLTPLYIRLGRLEETQPKGEARSARLAALRLRLGHLAASNDTIGRSHTWASDYDSLEFAIQREEAKG